MNFDFARPRSLPETGEPVTPLRGSPKFGLSKAVLFFSLPDSGPPDHVMENARAAQMPCGMFAKLPSAPSCLVNSLRRR